MSIFSFKEKEKQQDFLRAHNASHYVALPHIAGLPIAEGTVFDIFLHPDSLEMTANGAVFNLLLNKITNVGTISSVDIQKQYVSSVGGAIAGGMLFGAVGAAIGGRAKEKTSKTVTSYFIITYKKDNAVEQIAFEVNVRKLSVKMLNDFGKLFEALKAKAANNPVNIDL